VVILKKNKASSQEVPKQHSSNDFMNFTYKIDIREKIITMQLSLLQYSIRECIVVSLRKDLIHSLLLGEEEFLKLVKSKIDNMLDPIPTKLIKDVPRGQSSYH